MTRAKNSPPGNDVISDEGEYVSVSEKERASESSAKGQFACVFHGICVFHCIVSPIVRSLPRSNVCRNLQQ